MEYTTSKERVMSTTMSVDEYFDELISQVYQDYAEDIEWCGIIIMNCDFCLPSPYEILSPLCLVVKNISLVYLIVKFYIKLTIYYLFDI